MSSTVLARVLRQPFIWLGIAALVVAGLFLLESGGKAPAPQPIPIHLTSNGTGTDFGNSAGNPDKHCQDGHGQDGTHNKHCRGASGGQTQGND